jgi:pentatricopeptide repeat protein
MVKKLFLLSSVLFGLLFFVMSVKVPAESADQLSLAEMFRKEGNYENAEWIYRQIVTDFPDSNDALQAQKKLTIMYIATGRQQEADRAFGELTVDFAEHKGIAKAILQVGQAYTKAKKYANADEIHQYNVEKYTTDKFAMWSQVEIIRSLIRENNDAASDAAVDKLRTVFSAQPTLPKEIHQIANRYKKAGRTEKALELHKYNVEHFPSRRFTMLSQVKIIHSCMREDNNVALDAAVDKFLTAFSDRPTLPKEIRQIANRFNEAGRNKKAIELHNYNADNFPDNYDAMLSQHDIIDFYLGEGKDANEADAAANKLLSVFSKQPSLPKDIYEIAGKFAKAGRTEKALQIHQYNVDAFPDDPNAMSSQVKIAFLHIRRKDGTAAIDSAVNKLLNDFYEQPMLPQMIWQVARRLYRNNKMRQKGLDLHLYNVVHYPEKEHGMRSQVEIVAALIRNPNADQIVVDAAFDKLLKVFSDQPTLPKEIRRIANIYNKAGKPEKAMELRAYNIENSPNNVNAMLSQLDIVYSYIDKGDEAAVDVAVEKLLNVFSQQPTLPKNLHQIGNRYRKAGKYGRAIEFYQIVSDIWPDNISAILSQEAVAGINISLGDDNAVEAITDALIADHNDHPLLPKVVFRIGEEYYKMAFEDANNCQRVKSKENINKAANIWEKIVAQWPQSQALDVKHAWNFLANCYRKKGDYKKAVECYQKMLDNWPNYRYAWSAQCLIAECYEKLRDSASTPPSEAEDKIEQAYQAVIEKYPNCSLVPHASFKLARLNMDRDQKVKAAMYLETFLETANTLDPRIEKVKAELEKLGGYNK